MISLPEKLTIASCDSFHERLCAACEREDPIAIDAAGVTTIDLAGLQILLSAARSAKAAGRPFHLHAPPGGVVAAALTAAALDAPLASLTGGRYVSQPD